MKTYLNILLLSGAACALSLAVNASEDTHNATQAAANTNHSSTQSRVFDNNTNSHGTNTQPAATQTANVNNHGQAPSSANNSHWTYTGADGPENWGSMNADYHLCSAGKMQSPVDIAKGLSVDVPEISFKYSPAGLVIGNNGHTIQVNYGAGSHIIVDGRRFDLLQFHFHTPSEHQITGKTYPMEMHLVHKDANGALAVVGVMFESGSDNIALGEIWNHLPHQAGSPGQIPGVVVNARDLLPANQQYHHYKGSLTTPPCSEGVNWFVMDTPNQIGAMQIAQFMNIIGENARPVQAAHNRLFISGQ